MRIKCIHVCSCLCNMIYICTCMRLCKLTQMGHSLSAAATRFIVDDSLAIEAGCSAAAAVGSHAAAAILDSSRLTCIVGQMEPN